MTQFDWYIPEDRSNLSMNDLVIEVLVRLNISSFNELVKISGLADSLSALRPNYRNICNNIVLEARKRLGIKGNGVDAILACFMFGQATCVPSDKLIGEVKERGAVGVDYDCLFKRAPPEYCLFQSHYATEFVCDALDPGYECIFTHHLASGDPYCRYVFKKKSDPNNVLEDLGETIATIHAVEIPKEQAQAFSIYGCHQWWQTITGAFVDLNGPEKAKEVLTLNAKGIGKEVGQNLAKFNVGLGKDADSMGQFVDGFQKALNQKGTYKLVLNDESAKTITDCVCQIMLPAICSQYEAVLQGIVETINPNFEFSYDRMMTKGDKTCHWTIRKKGEEGKAKEMASSDDLAKQLGQKYINGEITEEEFDKKMANLRKHGLVK